MKFCQECGALMLPGKDKNGNKIFKCRCGVVEKFSEDESENYRISTEIKRDFKQEVVNAKDIIDWKQKNLRSSIKDFKCPKCGYNKASLETRQTRSADEGMTV